MVCFRSAGLDKSGLMQLVSKHPGNPYETATSAVSGNWRASGKKTDARRGFDGNLWTLGRIRFSIGDAQKWTTLLNEGRNDEFYNGCNLPKCVELDSTKIGDAEGDLKPVGNIWLRA